MEPLNTSDGLESPNDAISRRVLNRERQRRYRARKRALDAEIKKSQSTDLVVVPQHFNGELANCTSTKVQCRRSWKKDARNAHAFTSTNNDQPLFLSSPINDGVLPDVCFNSANSLGLSSNELHKPEVLGRRDWKAEARNKNN